MEDARPHQVLCVSHRRAPRIHHAHHGFVSVQERQHHVVFGQALDGSPLASGHGPVLPHGPATRLRVAIGSDEHRCVGRPRAVQQLRHKRVVVGHNGACQEPRQRAHGPLRGGLAEVHGVVQVHHVVHAAREARQLEGVLGVLRHELRPRQAPRGHGSTDGLAQGVRQVGGRRIHRHVPIFTSTLPRHRARVGRGGRPWHTALVASREQLVVGTHGIGCVRVLLEPPLHGRVHSMSAGRRHVHHLALHAVEALVESEQVCCITRECVSLARGGVVVAIRLGAPTCLSSFCCRPLTRQRSLASTPACQERIAEPRHDAGSWCWGWCWGWGWCWCWCWGWGWDWDWDWDWGRGWWCWSWCRSSACAGTCPRTSASARACVCAHARGCAAPRCAHRVRRRCSQHGIHAAAPHHALLAPLGRPHTASNGVHVCAARHQRSAAHPRQGVGSLLLLDRLVGVAPLFQLHQRRHLRAVATRVLLPLGCKPHQPRFAVQGVFETWQRPPCSSE